MKGWVSYRNFFFFRGCTLPDDGCNMARCQGLSKELSELSQEESKLDELIQSCTLDLKLLTEDSENQRYPFLVVVTSLQDCLEVMAVLSLDQCNTVVTCKSNYALFCTVSCGGDANK